MAYTRQYPNSITPQGTTTRGCLENDDKELKRVLDLLSSVGGLQLSGTKRQCVLYGPTDASGNPNFLTASGLTVSIDGSTIPVILSFANGFSISSGTVDSLAAITSAVSNAWIVPANGTYYLYIDKDMSTGLISYGVTASPDTYSKVAPTSPVLDQCYFNTNEMKMYHYNGSAWEQKYRIFVAVVVSTATVATVYTRSMISQTDTSLKNELSRGNKYIVGDIAYSNHLPTWARLECVTAGTTAPTEPDLSTYTTAGTYISDGPVKWIIADIRDAAPIGELQLFYSLHPGYVKANGATVNRADYPRLVTFAETNKLWVDYTLKFSGTTTANSATVTGISSADMAKLQREMKVTGTGIPAGTTISKLDRTALTITLSAVATAAGKIDISYGFDENFPERFGAGDGSTTFTLPNAIGRVLEAGTVADNIAAGLPNITGDSDYLRCLGYASYGVFSNSIHSTAPFGDGSYTSAVSLKFNASMSNPIYGESATVQSTAIRLIPQLRY